MSTIEENELLTKELSDISDDDFGDENLDDDDARFTWYTGPNFTPSKHEFSSSAGFDPGLGQIHAPLEFFKVFMDRFVVKKSFLFFWFHSHQNFLFHLPFQIDRIVDQTNTYQWQNLFNPGSHSAAWRDTTADEMYLFFATILLMGLIRKNKIHDYWSTNPLLSTPIFGKFFSRDRFKLLLRFLHFNNNASTSHQNDPLRKIIGVLTSLRNRFLNKFFPCENLCIDESLILWKGRLYFKQYIPSKRKRFGIKLFLLVDCRSKFIIDVIVYTGSRMNIERIENLGVGGSIVMKMMEKYLEKGHTLYVNNWYTSPALFQKLHDSGTNACGTIRKNRRDFPTYEGRLERGSQSFKFTRDLLAVKWKDKRDVFMLSTCHSPTMETVTSRRIQIT